jgi:hypothetical protein
MRIPVLGLAAAVTLLTAVASPVPAQAHYYPWCAHYTGADYGSAISCGYMTREQCMATVSGIGGFCTQNFPPPVQPARRPAPR